MIANVQLSECITVGNRFKRQIDRRLLKDKHKKGSYFLCFVKVYGIFFIRFCLMPEMHSGKIKCTCCHLFRYGHVYTWA